MFSTRPSWRRWCQSSERRPGGPAPPTHPPGFALRARQPGRGKTQKPCLGRPPAPTAVLPTTDVHSAVRECHPPNPTRPPPRHRTTRSPARWRGDPQGAPPGRLVPERGAMEAFHRCPYRSAPSPVLLRAFSECRPAPCHCRQSAAVDLVPHHGVAIMCLFEQAADAASALGSWQRTAGWFLFARCALCVHASIV